MTNPTPMTTLAERFRREAGGYDDIAAGLLARDLMKGDPANFKAGYTRENAIIAAVEVFPDVAPEEIDPWLDSFLEERAS